jgi:glutamate 5-kinase
MAVFECSASEPPRRITALPAFRHSAAASAVTGHIHVDAGAAHAIVHEGASLLPMGIIRADGMFQRGDMVEIVTGGDDGMLHVIARGIAQYGAAEINRIARTHTRDIGDRLGYSYGENVVHRDDLATLGDAGLLTGEYA